MLHVIQWYIVLLIFGWAAWPVTSYLLSAFKDKGYAFSRTLGLMLAGFLFWILTCFKILQNNTGGVLMSLVLVLAISISLQVTRKTPSYSDLVKSSWKSIIWVEGLFLVCFILIALWRAANPDITGTEKPMELAFINAILRSPTFPPADPWLSGYSISYYYFGYVIISMLIRLSGVVSGVGFNLMAASVFSLAAVGLYGLIFNLVNAPRVKNWFNMEEKTSYGLPLLAPLFTLVVSNAEGLFEFLFSRGLFWQQAADGSWVSPFWKWIDLQELQAYPTQVLSWWPSRPAGIIWWRASRVLSDYTLGGNFLEIIDEFPFFSFLLSDLHPHVLALPFAVLALAFGLNFLMGGADGKISLWGIELHLPYRYLVAIPVFLGGMAFMNTWDFPVHLGIFLLCYTTLRIREEGWSVDRIWELLAGGIILGGFSILFYLPFFIGFKSQAGGIVPSFIFSTRGAHFWIMFGTLLIPLLIFFATLLKKTNSYSSWKKGLGWASILVFGMWALSFLLAYGAMNLSKWGLSLSTSPVPALAAFGATMVEGGGLFKSIQGLQGESTLSAFAAAIGRRLSAPGAWITIWLIFTAGLTALFASDKKESALLLKQKEKVRPVDPTHDPLPAGLIFIIVLALSGALIALVPEFIYLRDQFGWRMNTIFKFYYQTWLLWSIAASFGVIFVIKKLTGTWQWVSSFLFSLTIVVGLLYPAIGLVNTTNTFHPFDLNLDGNAHLDEYQADDSEAMKWLAKAPYGVIAESVGGSYSAHARMSTQSGLPAVIGWTPHEGQWGRTSIEMGTRDQDIGTLYQTPDWLEAQTILDRYQIRYIVIGNLERSTYTVNEFVLNETKFNDNLPIVFQNNSVIIYEYTGSAYESE